MIQKITLLVMHVLMTTMVMVLLMLLTHVHSQKGRDAKQIVETLRPSLLIAKQSYDDVSFKGTFFVDSNYGESYFGLIFGYQSNRRFYLVAWQRTSANLNNNTFNGGLSGLHIKLVNSSTGPGDDLIEALWHSDSTINQVGLLWHDPKLQAWNHTTSYSFELEWKPSISRIRLKVKTSSSLIVDSGYLHDASISAGKLGLFTFGQHNVIWSNMKAECLRRDNFALSLNGIDSLITLPSIQTLTLTNSFTLGVWLKISEDNTNGKRPIICISDNTLCLSLIDRYPHGQVGYSTVKSSTQLTVNVWHYVSFRFDAQHQILSLFINGSLVSKTADVKTHSWATPFKLYIGSDLTSWYAGTIDEVSIWDVSITDSDIHDILLSPGLVWQKHQGLIQVHMTMNEKSKYNKVIDDSGNDFHGNFSGRLSYVKSSLISSRFHIAYPSNRKRRSNDLLHTEL